MTPPRPFHSLRRLVRRMSGHPPVGKSRAITRALRLEACSTGGENDRKSAGTLPGIWSALAWVAAIPQPKEGRVVREPVPGAVRQDNWFVLLDPQWQASSSGELPPAEVIAGGWLLDEAGETGPFQPNPDYVPLDASTPTDPTDAVLRLIAEGEQLGERLVATLRESVVQIACDRDNEPVVGSAPDGVRCVFVATAVLHQQGVSADRWWPVVGGKLPDIVPASTDILLNPGGPAQFRLVTDALRRAD